MIVATKTGIFELPLEAIDVDAAIKLQGKPFIRNDNEVKHAFIHKITGQYQIVVATKLGIYVVGRKKSLAMASPIFMW